MQLNQEQQTEMRQRIGTRPLPFFHDRLLPNLWQLADAPAMRQRFQGYFRLRYSEHRLRVVGCSIEKLYYRPERNCKALYRLQLEDRANQTSDQWFFAQMYPVEKSFAKFSRAQEKAATAVSFWESVSFWPEIDTIFWAFPHDPQLTQLPTLLEPQTIPQLLATHLPAAELGDTVQCQRLKLMPRKRCLLQFTVGDTRLVTKSYAQTDYHTAKGRYAYQIFSDVYQATQTNPWLTVPEPLFYDEELATHVQAWCKGKPPTATASIEKIHKAATALAQFHQLGELPHLQPSQRTAGLVQRVQTDANLLGHFLPYDLRLPTVTNQLTLAAIGLAGKTTLQTPTHGAFRLNQLLDNNGRFTLLDLDDAGWGDPVYDVAECMASIQMAHFTDDLNLAELQANAETFKLAYVEQVPWQVDSARLHGFIALSLFQKLAGAFRRLETAVYPKIDSLFGLIEQHLEQAV